ncbi:MAG: histone H1 [Bacteroidaceae bacterium]|nr:histone H1 [Bacteroidaceae bacterium]
MNELIAKIKELAEALLVDAAAQAEKGNKAAGTRARKASLELEKALKEFRKVSLEESKK